jgi:hypothetical protein
MQIHTPFFILLAALFCGCAGDHFMAGRGDVGQFILQQAIARGGSPATNSLPTISGRWRYSEDKDGVVIRMSRGDFSAVENFLRQSFGRPKLEPTELPDDKSVGAYRLSSKGGAIQFSHNAKETQIIVIRSMSTAEIMRGVVDTLGEKQ